MSYWFQTATLKLPQSHYILRVEERSNAAPMIAKERGVLVDALQKQEEGREWLVLF